VIVLRLAGEYFVLGAYEREARAAATVKAVPAVRSIDVVECSNRALEFCDEQTIDWLRSILSWADPSLGDSLTWQTAHKRSTVWATYPLVGYVDSIVPFQRKLQTSRGLRIGHPRLAFGFYTLAS
jgi:hypothetical protein